MTLLSLLGRIMRYFLLRPETLFLLCISLALWSYFFHTDEVKTIVKSSRDAVKMVKGKVAEIMQNDRLGGLDVLEALELPNFPRPGSSRATTWRCIPSRAEETTWRTASKFSRIWPTRRTRPSSGSSTGTGERLQLNM